MQTTLAQPPSNTLSSSSKSPAKPAHRLLELDALRGLAAVAVMLFHYTYGYDKYIAARPDLPFHVLYGDRGVYLFFVLSGFVISWTLARTRTASDFVVGRFSRLYPAFWAAVPLTYFIVAASDLTQLQVSPRDALLNLTMIPNMLGVASVDGAYWSLQVELCFYATVLTLWLTGAWRRPLAVLAAWLAVATCWGLVLQLNLLPEGPVTGLATKLSTAANLKFISLFGIGICFYQWRERGRASAAIWTLLAACLAVDGDRLLRRGERLAAVSLGAAARLLGWLIVHVLSRASEHRLRDHRAVRGAGIERLGWHQCRRRGFDPLGHGHQLRSGTPGHVVDSHAVSQQQAVRHHRNAAQRHGRGRRDGGQPEPAQRHQNAGRHGDQQQVINQRPRQILMNGAQRRSGQPYGLRDLPQVGAHQHDVGRFDRHVGSRPNRDP
jgi:peptidoglycan/LPS O-acetylase OafA/YrhL